MRLAGAAGGLDWSWVILIHGWMLYGLDLLAVLMVREWRTL
jgi:hypothetical protein